MYVSVRTIAQAGSRRLLSAEVWVRSQNSPCGICGGESGSGTGFSPSPSAFLVIESIIPPLLHIQSCMIWASAYGFLTRNT
jgi:hypothetical protein